MKKRDKLIVSIIMTAYVMSVGVGCQSVQPTPTNQSGVNSMNTLHETESQSWSDETFYLTEAGSQIITNDDYIRIGVMGVREPSEDNEKASARLVFFVKGRPDLEEARQVHEGDKFIIAGHRIRITDISVEGDHVGLKVALPQEETTE